MKAINSFFLSLIVLAGCHQPSESVADISLPFYNQADFTPEWIATSEPQFNDIHTVAPFKLTNQDGETVTEKDLEGMIYVANFFFSICPTVCPRMTNNLLRIQEEFIDDEEVLMVSHTVMPWIDTVEVLKEYAIRNDIQTSKWQLLTGSKKDLYTLGRQSYFADEGFGKSVTLESDFLHTENIVLVDKQLRIRGVYNGTLPLEMTRLIEDIKRLKEEDLKT